jgi:hypothetical protein
MGTSSNRPDNSAAYAVSGGVTTFFQYTIVVLVTNELILEER